MLGDFIEAHPEEWFEDIGEVRIKNRPGRRAR